MARKTAQLRQLVEQEQILVAPGAYDAITAIMVEAAGFSAAYMTGAGTANGLLGLPDIGLATLTEMVCNASQISSAVSIPVICDADTGYGNALSVIRTVKEFEKAGVAAIHIEDQEAPKRCGHLDGKRLIPTAEMIGKIEAAVDTRHDEDFLIIARTDSALVEGIEAAIERAHRYAEAGADVIFPEALVSRTDFARFANANIPVPLMANMTEFGKSPYLSARELQEIGFQLVIFPMAAFRAMLYSVDEVLREIRREGTQVGFLQRMKTRDELYELLRHSSYAAAERRFVDAR